MEKIKLYFLNNKKLILSILICVILVIGLGIYFYFEFYVNDNQETLDLTFDSLINEESNDSSLVDDNLDNQNNETIVPDIIEYIYVDIKGYVNKPGVYKIDKNEDKRINDLINLAGGLKKDADTSIINMSHKLYDEMVVIIYSKKEINNFLETKKKQEEKLEICEKEEVKNDGCLSDKDIIDSSNQTNNDSSSDNSNQDSSVVTSKVNINTATKETLMTLNGIGESKAESIISYRNEVGLFKTIDELKNVSGIGDNLFESIKENITIE